MAPPSPLDEGEQNKKTGGFKVPLNEGNLGRASSHTKKFQRWKNISVPHRLVCCPACARLLSTSEVPLDPLLKIFTPFLVKVQWGTPIV